LAWEKEKLSKKFATIYKLSCSKRTFPFSKWSNTVKLYFHKATNRGAGVVP
jgi:hypothetical protein